MTEWPTHLKLWMSCTLMWAVVGWVKGSSSFRLLWHQWRFLTSVSNTTHLALLLCSFFVSVKPPGAGYGNWPGLLACHHSCGAGVRQTYTCTPTSCCIHLKEPELAFCSCHPPATFTRHCKILCVMLFVLQFWGFRYGCLSASASLFLSRLHGLGMSLVTTSTVLQNPYFHTSVSLEQMLTSQCTACFNVASSQDE